LDTTAEILLGQVLFSALAAALVLFMLSRRGRTMTEGREYAVVEVLSVVNRTLPYLRHGLNRDTAPRVAEALLPYLGARAVGIVSGSRILAHAGAGADHHKVGEEPLTALTRQVLRTARPVVARTAESIHCARADCPLRTAVGAPLLHERAVVGCLQVYFLDQGALTPNKIRMVSAVAHLMSIEMELSELDRTTQRLAVAERRILQAQISPHFVYNTLNAIASFVRTDPDKARELITDFADFLRRSVRQDDEFSPFAHELEYVHQYLSFEKARLGDRLSVVYRVSPEVLSTVVPTLVLQPLVENAVRHGIAPKDGNGRLLVAAEDRGQECWISVEDDGVGMDAESLRRALKRPRSESSGVGLRNVNDRLRRVYGGAHGLDIQSHPGGGTRVTFSVPKYMAGVSA
jgi:LytS/YehU family sensor histidine kinase